MWFKNKTLSTFSLISMCLLAQAASADPCSNLIQRRAKMVNLKTEFTQLNSELENAQNQDKLSLITFGISSFAGGAFLAELAFDRDYKKTLPKLAIAISVDALSYWAATTSENAAHQYQFQISELESTFNEKASALDRKILNLDAQLQKMSCN
jgi:prefoldin subunit 5